MDKYKSLQLKSDIEVKRLIFIYRTEIRPSLNPVKAAEERFDFWHFIFVESGVVVISTAGDNYILNAGEIVFFEPDHPHGINSFENGEATYISVAVSFNSTDPDFFQNKIMALNSFEHENLYYALKCSHRLYEGLREKNGVAFMKQKKPDDQPFGSEQMLKLHLELLLLSTRQRGIGEAKEHRINSFAKQTRQKSLTQQIQGYLNEHMSETLSLEQIANDIGYSVSQMQKSFKNEMGESIIDYYIGIKMDRAKLMISEGNLTFTEIAKQLGYENPNYFTRIFKRRVGVTPTQYANL